MDIGNRKISARQLGRMAVYDYFPLTTLILPVMLSKSVGMDGFFALSAGGVAGYALLLLVLSQEQWMRKRGQSYGDFLQTCFGGWLTRLILLVYLAALWFGTAYGLQLLCSVSEQYLIRDTSARVILAVIVFLAVFGLWGGVESRGRMYELVFWFVLLPFLFLLILAGQNVEPDRWVPVFCAEGPQFFKHSYLVFAFLMGSICLPMRSENISEHADTARVMKQVYIFCISVNLVLFLLLTGIFGAPTVATMDHAVLTLTAMVKVPGGFLERQDAFLCGIWLISLFAFVENMMYAMTWCMKRMRGTQEYRGTLYIAGALVYVLALAMHDSVRLVSWLGTCYVQYVVPVLVGIVLVSYILMKWREKKSLQGNETCGEENG